MNRRVHPIRNGYLPVALGAALLALACAKPHLGVRADAPPVPGPPHATWTFAGARGESLFARSWRPDGDPRGVVVIVHGLRDHGDRYAPFAGALARRGYAVHAFDLRGHGRSAGRRVTVDSFDDYVADLDTFTASVREREAGKPLFVFGHSMGGAIAIRWAQTHQGAAGVILSAPAIRIDTLPIVAAATVLSGTLTPNFGGLAPDNKGFSTVAAVERDMGADPLIHQPPGPVGTARELVGAIERVWAEVDRLDEPLLCLHGTADTLTAPAGSRDLCTLAASPDKTLRLYEGQAHDLVHEPAHDRITADVVAWLDAHTGGEPVSFEPADPKRRLRGDGSKPSASVAFEAGYRRSDTDDAAQLVGAATRTRFLLGRRLAWPLLLDAELLGGDELVWRAAGYPIGVALVSPRGEHVSLAFGAGVSDLGGGVDLELPLALDAEAQLGPIRVLVWGRLVWLPGADEGDARAGGTDVSFADELHLGVALRLGRNHRYWSTVNAGVGPYLGVTLDQQAGVNVLGIVIGLHLWGGS
jgi:alpha-beta hydrolase superfamily lysophospholipase